MIKNMLYSRSTFSIAIRHLLPQRRQLASLTTSYKSGVSEFIEERILRFPPAHVFSVIAGVEHYHQFVPWCVKSSVTVRSPSGLNAELAVGFGQLCAQYTSAVTFEPSNRVRAVASGTPLFEILENEWSLTPGETPNTTALRFAVRWRFRSALLGSASEAFKEEVARRMVTAFDARCAATSAAWMAEERKRIEEADGVRERKRIREAVVTRGMATKGTATTSNGKITATPTVAPPPPPTTTTSTASLPAPPRYPPPPTLGPGLWC